MEVEGGAGEEREHEALGDGAPEDEFYRVAEDQEDAGEGDGEENTADLDPLHTVFGVAIFFDAEEAESIGEEPGVGGGGAEDGGVKYDNGADEEEVKAPFAEG